MSRSYSLTDPAWIDKPGRLFSIDLDPNEQQPFKVQVVHQDEEKRLQYFQKPIGNEEGLFFQATSLKMKHIIKNQIKTYSLYVQNQKYNQELRQNENGAQLNFFEATQQIFHGNQFLSTRNPNYNPQAQQMREQVDNIVSKEVENKWQQQLICSIYSGQNLKQLNEFVDAIEQSATLLFFVNGLENLNKEILEKLEQIQNFSEETKYNQNNVHSAMIAQYQCEKNQNWINIFFICRYNQGSISQIYSWIFQGISKYFDPTYVWILDASIIPNLKSLESQQNNVKDNHICGVYGRIQYECRESLFDITNPLLSKYMILRCQNNLLDLAVNPLECFYRWNDTKYVVDQLCQIVLDSEKEMKLGNVCQSQNSILFQLLQAQNKEIIKVDDYYGKQIINPKEIMKKLSQLINSQYQNYKLSTVKCKNQFQQMIYQILLFTRLVNHYFFISALLYILFVCPYIIINDNIISYDTLLKLVLPLIAILAFIIIFNITNLIQPHSQMYVRHSDQDIFVDGKIYIQCVRSDNKVTIKWLMKQEEMKINGKQLDQEAKVQFQSKSNAQTQEIQLILRINQRKYKSQVKKSDQIFSAIQQYIDSRQQNHAIYAINQQKILFQFLFEEQNSQKLYSLFYLVGAIINVSICAMLLYVIYNKFIFNNNYGLMIVISLIAIIGEVLMGFVNQRGNFIQYFKGQIGQLFVYIPLEVCVRFYAMNQSDKSFENKKVNNYYYPKVFALARYFTFNIICVFLMINIELWLNASGYVLLTLICYQGVQSGFNIILSYIEKIYTVFQIVHKSKINTNESLRVATQEDHTALSYQDFTFEEMNFDEFQIKRLELMETYKKKELVQLQETCNVLEYKVKEKKSNYPIQAASQYIQNRQVEHIQTASQFLQNGQQENIQAASQILQNKKGLENPEEDPEFDQFKSNVIFCGK